MARVLRIYNGRGISSVRSVAPIENIATPSNTTTPLYNLCYNEPQELTCVQLRVGAMQTVCDRYETVAIRSKFCGKTGKSNLRSAVCQDIVTGGRPLAALAGIYRFECSACGNRRRACPAVIANSRCSGDASNFAELVVKSLYKSKNARTVSSRELAEFAAVFAAQGFVDQLAAVAKAMPLTAAPLVQRVFSRYPPELPPSPHTLFKLATAGLNILKITPKAVKSIDLTVPSDSDDESADDESEEEHATPGAGFEQLPIDEHILAQRVEGWVHWLERGEFNELSMGWKPKIAHAIHHASRQQLPVELCNHIVQFLVVCN